MPVAPKPSPMAGATLAGAPSNFPVYNINEYLIQMYGTHPEPSPPPPAPQRPRAAIMLYDSRYPNTNIGALGFYDPDAQFHDEWVQGPDGIIRYSMRFPTAMFEDIVDILQEGKSLQIFWMEARCQLTGNKLAAKP